MQKQILEISTAPDRHWVGDGFPVHGLFGYSGEGVAQRSPFLMLDYAAPTRFDPAGPGQRRGVGTHPHRGFETVTIVYEGEVEHRDSTGQGGVIGPGDVQWMTAASGILHEEFHSARYSERGGPFEMVQLWVNLRARDKMTAPGYQAVLDADIPSVDLPGDAGRVRVIAGDHGGVRGPARTHSPIHVLDVRLRKGHEARLSLPEGWTTLVVALDGRTRVNAQDGWLTAPSVATLSHQGTELNVLAGEADAKLLVLAGEPLNEPVVGYGPFVMNSRAEIVQAVDDFNAGRFGRMA